MTDMVKTESGCVFVLDDGDAHVQVPFGVNPAVVDAECPGGWVVDHAVSHHMGKSHHHPLERGTSGIFKAILAALQANDGRCLDSAEERAEVAHAVEESIHRHIAALVDEKLVVGRR